MSRDTCFATQGELAKLAYDAFGVLPRKGSRRTSKEASRDGIDETQKKAIQKQLARLAEEEGGLLSNFGQVIQTLSSILTAYLPSIQIMSGIGDPLDDLLEAYTAWFAKRAPISARLKPSGTSSRRRQFLCWSFR